MINSTTDGRSSQPDDQPNIVLVMADQMTAFALSMYGNTVTQTPNLDQLASSGTVFQNAYCNYPLCAPARFSLMSGRLPSRIGAYDNAAELPASIPTIAHYLRDAGYYTCLAGKMHFVGPDQHHGMEDRLTTEIYPADFSWTPPETYAAMSTSGLADDEEVPLGVSSVETITDAAPVSRSLQMDYDDEVIHRACQHLYDRKRYGDGRPLFMTVSFTQPHDPYVSRREFWDLYEDEDIDDPRVPPIPLKQMDPHSQSLFHHYSLHKFDVTQDIYRRARHGYYAMISDVDNKLGLLRTALADCGMTDNTIVIFTSDHGDMLGERGLWFKKTLYEPAIRIPMIMSWPGRTTPAKIQAPCSLVDLLPTIVEMATGSTDSLLTEADGESLVDLFSTDMPERAVKSEHIDGGTIAPRVMLRKGTMKMVYSEEYPMQLFNLEDDPGELNDLAATSEWKQTRDSLLQEIEATWDLGRLKQQVIENQRVRQMLLRSLNKGRTQSWEHYPNPAETSTRWVRAGDRFPEVEQRGYLRYPAE
ncbi:MAG: choline-sulfatase [Granulosicoccus sp.]|nr:choline-sulfatase [Granulosicoccus sp.]